MTVTDLLDELDIAFRRPGEDHHASAGWLALVCPRCGKGTGSHHLGISTEGYTNLHCFKCGRLPLVQTLSEASSKPLSVVRGIFARFFGDRSFTGLPDALEQAKKLKLPSGIGPLLPVHERYLASRFNSGKIREIENLWQVQGIGLHQHLAFRLFLPIHGDDSKVVSWTTRAASDDAYLRYVSAARDEEAVPHKSLLYGERFCRHAVVIVEGPIDAWNVGPGACATFGVSVTREQIGRMLRFPVRAVCLDVEPQAQQRARELCATLECFEGRTVRVELDAEDPGSASEREIKRLRESFLD